MDREPSGEGEVAHAGRVRGADAESVWTGGSVEQPARGERAGQGTSIGGADENRGLAAQLLDRPLGDDPAVGDDDDVIDDVVGLGQHVARDEHRLALRGEVAQEGPQPSDAFGVQAVGGLVEDDDVRVGEQRCGETEPLAHAHGVAAGPLAGSGGDADQFEELVHPRVRGAARVGKDPQVIAPTAARVEVGRFESRADDLHGVGEVLVAVFADERLARGRADEPEEHAHRRRLAGAVGAEESGDPRRLHRKGEVVDCDKRAELFGQVSDVERDPGGSRGGGWGRGVCRDSGHRRPPDSRVMTPSKHCRRRGAPPGTTIRGPVGVGSG